MEVPNDVRELIEEVVARAREVLGDALAGVYLRGSLVTGDFEPDRSDVDLLAATQRRISSSRFEALKAMHAEIAKLPNPYSTRYEIAYIDRVALRRFVAGQQHPTLGQGESLQWYDHGANWLLERWTVREHGITLCGPDPRTLIDPIGPDDLLTAVRVRLREWADWLDDPDEPMWLTPRRWEMAYAVETICRGLCAIETNTLPSKQQAVTWALVTLDSRWQATVERSQRWRRDLEVDYSIVPEARRFIAWSAEVSGTPGDGR